jgi:deoxyribodipyrimidine photolyase
MTLKCYCPDDCNCHSPWRTNYCGCKQHEEVQEETRETRQEPIPLSDHGRFLQAWHSGRTGHPSARSRF